MVFEFTRNNSGNRFISLFVLVFAAALGSALAIASLVLLARKCEPRLEYHENVHDFGSVVPYAKLKHIFSLRNAGKAPLTIADIVADCGCLSAKVTNDVIKPGETEQLEVLFEVPDQRAQWKKNVTLFTNDAVDPIHRFDITADIIPKLDVQPRAIEFGMLSKKQLPASKSVKILPTKTAASHNTIQIKAISNSDYLSVQVRDIPGSPDKELITVLKENAPSGAITERVSVDVNDGNTSTLTISVMGQITGDIYATPSTFLFGMLQAGQFTTKEVRLCGRNGRPISVISVELSQSLKGIMSISIDNDSMGPILRATLKTPKIRGRNKRTQKTDGFVRVIARSGKKDDNLQDKSFSKMSLDQNIPDEEELRIYESINIPVLAVIISEKPSEIGHKDNNKIY